MIFKNNALKNELDGIVRSKINQDIIETKYLGGGSYGKAYCVTLSGGEKIVLKSYRLAGMNESEAQQLKFLSTKTSVPMPEVLFTYSNDSISLLAMSYISGRNVLNPEFLLCSKSQKLSFADQVISGMLEWHSVTNRSFGDIDSPKYSSWYELYRNTKVNEVLSGLELLVKNGSFSSKRYDALCEATELYDKCYEEPENAVLIHGDLNIMNIMAKPKTLELTGFIDPYGSMWADREYDLFQLQNMWGNKYYLYDTYKKMCGNMRKESDFRITYYGVMNEASCHLNGGPMFPIWEDLWFNRLKKQKQLLRL